MYLHKNIVNNEFRLNIKYYIRKYNNNDCGIQKILKIDQFKRN